MTEEIKAQHPPAKRVGGRRLSMSMKPKAPIPAEAVTNASPQADETETETTVPDYPRPAAPAEEATQQHQQEVHRNEEEPKKDKKYIVQESSYWKTRPTRVLNERNKGHIGTRIGQPAGKAFGA